MMPENQITPDGQGKRTFPLLHEKVWEDLYNQYHNQFGDYVPDEYYLEEDSCPYAEIDYTQIPRGRIFSTDDGYQIYVGDWINCDDYEYIVDLIEEQFNLPYDETEVIIDSHWDIGSGWGE